MRFFERDPTRPGNVTLQIGLSAYLLTLVLSVAAVNTGSNIAMAALGGFVSGPVRRQLTGWTPQLLSSRRPLLLLR
jgi:hypothetical protein